MQAQSNSFDQMMTTQIVSMGFMNGGTIYSAIISYVILKLVAIVSALIPVLQSYGKKMFEKWYNDKYGKNNIMDTLIKARNGDLDNKDDIISLIKFDFNKEVNNSDVTMQAVMAYISSSKNCSNILYSLQFYVVNEEEFKIADDVYCRVTFFEHDDKGYMDKYSFELYSRTLSIYKLREFVNRIVVDYQAEQNNQLGNNIYFFNEMHVDIPMSMDGELRLEMAPKNLTFTMTQFNTNKSLHNLYGRHLNIAKERVHRFVNKPDWYAKKGIPHTLGIMLHGPPGSGKTSFIKATAKDLNRHIINIKLQKTTTKTQLMDLFFNTEITVLRNGQSVKIYIPLDKRIYVMEDIDSLTDIVLDRKIQFQKIGEKLAQKMENINMGNSSAIPSGSTAISSFMRSRQAPVASKAPNVEDVMRKQQSMNPDALNLSFLLNLLDGILETPGRVLIITTNHPEKLDSALIRPGRIDVPLEVGYCSIATIEEMLEGYYETHVSLPEKFKDEYNMTITPAEVYSLMQNNDNIELCTIEECIEQCIEDLHNKSLEKNNKKQKEDEKEAKEEDDKDKMLEQYSQNIASMENELNSLRAILEEKSKLLSDSQGEKIVSVENDNNPASSVRDLVPAQPPSKEYMMAKYGVDKAPLFPAGFIQSSTVKPCDTRINRPENSIGNSESCGNIASVDETGEINIEEMISEMNRPNIEDMSPSQRAMIMQREQSHKLIESASAKIHGTQSTGNSYDKKGIDGIVTSGLDAQFGAKPINHNALDDQINFKGNQRNNMFT